MKSDKLARTYDAQNAMRTNLFVATAFAHNHRRVIAVCVKVCQRLALRRMLFLCGCPVGVERRKRNIERREQLCCSDTRKTGSKYIIISLFSILISFIFFVLFLICILICCSVCLRRLPLCLFSSRLPSGRKLQSPYDDCERSQLRQIDLSAWTSELRSSPKSRRDLA